MCNQGAADKWAQYEEGMEQKYGSNWKLDHPDLDVAVIYESVGRMPHGKLAIADGAISITEKEAIKTKKRSAQPYTSAREKRLERENERLQKENGALQEFQRVLRALVAKGGMDYDALAQETGTNLGTSESEVGFTKVHESVDKKETKNGNNDADARDLEDEDDYYNDDEDYDDEGDGEYGNKGGGYSDDGDNYNNYDGEDYSRYDNFDNDYDGW